MALVSLNVLDGFDSGRVFSRIPTPVTIGREEGNSVRLNDERISRFHLKVQEDQGRVVLTDLESTNGTRVNGESVRLALLRPGDQIRIGGTLLVYGSPEEILLWINRASGNHSGNPHGNGSDAGLASADDPDPVPHAKSPSPPGAAGGAAADKVPAQTMLSSGKPPAGSGQPIASPLDDLWGQSPPLPGDLSPGQAAQLSELLCLLHRRLRNVIDSIAIDQDDASIRASLPDWQRVLSFQMDLARLIREIAEPR